MVTQDRLIVTFSKNAGTVYIDLNSLPSQSVLFSFHENEETYIALKSTRYKVYIEWKENDSTFDYKYLREMHNGDSFKLNDNENSYYPSYYLIRIEDKFTNKVVFKNFNVLPLVALDSNEMFDNMRTIISNYKKSFLYDYSKQKYVSIVESELENENVVEKCEYLKENITIINNALINVVNNPIISLDKKIERSTLYGKQNAKSLLKNIANNNMFYNVKTVENFDVGENYTLKYYLLESNKKLAELNDRIDNLISLFENIVFKHNKAIERANQSNFKERLIDQLNETKGKLKLFKDAKNIIEELIFKVSNLIYDSYLTNVKRDRLKLNDKFFKNNNYSVIYNKLYLGLTKTVSDSELATNMKYTGYAYKSTATLYEIYSLLFLIRVIENNGFILDPTKDSFDIRQLDVIESNITFYYTNGLLKCKLIYDKLVNRYGDEEHEDDELINLECSHNRPDFQLLFYDEKGNFLDGMILDAKCRRFNAIKLDTNDSMLNTVFDYIRFRYLPKGSPLIKSKSAVSSLFLLCPDVTLVDPLIDEVYGIVYFPLKPTNNLLGSKMYVQFNQYFNEFLNEVLSKIRLY